MSATGHTTSDANITTEPAVAVVAIVLSAGGLTPLRRLIRGVRGDLPAAFIIAQHVHRVTFLPEILRADTSMDISLAASGVALQSRRVYVCPAAKHVIVNPDATLTVSGRDRLRSFRPSADWLFESAAASFAERAFAVVLSGRQDDGAHGVVAVRNAGGTVIVQAPATSEHAEMPSAAIATACVDHVLPSEEIARLLNTELTRISVRVCEGLRDDPFG